MNTTNQGVSCCCSNHEQNKAGNVPEIGKKTAGAASSVLLSFFIAFFPKCPVCWAAYMSMFGSVGLAKLPYMEWLYPALALLLVFYLYLLYRRVKQKGYGPFVLSLSGAVLMMIARLWVDDNKWMLLTSMVFVFTGSLWNNFVTTTSASAENKQLSI